MSDPGSVPHISPTHDTPQTTDWEQNLQLNNDMYAELENNMELSADAEHFHSEMVGLQAKLTAASAKLKPDMQSKGVLIDRLSHYKSPLEDAWDVFLTSSKKAAT